MIDVRNDYEIRIGKFKGAVDPRTTAFREFPSWVDDEFQLSPSDAQVECRGSSEQAEKQIEEERKSTPRVAMYCTGGIRCEKASSFLLGKGFKEVSHECNLHCYHLSITLLLSAGMAITTNLIMKGYIRIIFYSKSQMVT